jgi:hypothetical protein
MLLLLLENLFLLAKNGIFIDEVMEVPITTIIIAKRDKKEARYMIRKRRWKKRSIMKEEYYDAWRT